MNEELQILLDLMNGKGNAAQLLSRGPGDGNNKGSQVTTLDNQNSLSSINTGEVEVTPEMKTKFPVVNNARKKNKLSGVSDFLANPEVQNALLQFGRAFSEAGNYTGVPGVGSNLADAGENVIRGNANQKALEAFERGEDPAQAAGRFADPELVSRLQQQQSQIEQFNEQIDIQQQSLGLEEKALKNNKAYQTAKLTQDAELAREQMQLQAEGQEIEKGMVEARKDLIRAQEALAYARANAAGRQNAPDVKQLAEATTEYLDTLQQQRLNLQDQLSSTEKIKKEITGGGWDFNTDEAWVRRQARDLGIPVTDAEGNLDMSRVVEEIEAYESRLQRQINATQDQEEILRVAQSQRLGTAEENVVGEGGEGDEGLEPRGTRENPVTVSMDELYTLPPESYATVFGDKYYIGQDGQPRLIEGEENE